MRTRREISRLAGAGDKLELVRFVDLPLIFVDGPEPGVESLNKSWPGRSGAGRWRDVERVIQ